MSTVQLQASFERERGASESFVRPRFSAAQWVRIRRLSKAPQRSPADGGGELNIVPLLDIVMNVMLFVLATVTTVFTTTIPVPAPTQDNGNGSAIETVVVKVTGEGFIVGTNRGFVQRDCRSLGAAQVTVPAVMGAHDFNSLTRCLVTLRDSPALSAPLRRVRSINVAGNGALPYALLVRTLDAVRETRPAARDLFPLARLGVL